MFGPVVHMEVAIANEWFFKWFNGKIGYYPSLPTNHPMIKFCVFHSTCMSRHNTWLNSVDGINCQPMSHFKNESLEGLATIICYQLIKLW